MENYITSKALRLTRKHRYKCDTTTHDHIIQIAAFDA